jgi:hypothetical protein
LGRGTILPDMAEFKGDSGALCAGGLCVSATRQPLAATRATGGLAYIVA